MFFQNVTHHPAKSAKLFIGVVLSSLPRAKPPVDVTTGYQLSEPASVADVGWG
jgi:hypothetical protein